ncbi:ADP-ribosylglycohydrolase [Streptomyces spiroverticillatus]|nr:ADP-ribosylglycohydrolase family protein [Streptomyces finlayi]GHA19837.1 ADP-ribosylglycohydrolase [Streptomyces spiroverticillatus]
MSSSTAAATAAASGVWGRTEQQDFRSRVRGALLGGAIGDALGAAVDSLSLDEIRAGCGEAGVVDLLPAYGRRGAITAGTQQTLFTVDGLIRAQVRRDTGAWHPPTDVHRAYLRWAATQHDWGPDERRPEDGWLAREEWLYVRRSPTRECLGALKEPAMGTLEAPHNPASRDAVAVVRAAPFGLLVGWEAPLVFQLAAECAALTHGHPVSCLAAGALAVLVHGVARGEGLDAAVQRALAQLAARPGHQLVSDALRAALDGVRQGLPTPERVEALGDGRTPEGVLAVAVYCALVGEDVGHGLRLAVNHGGASAACGALCGALLGAMHGETALPAGWVVEVEGRSTLLELADDFAMEMTQGASLHTPGAGSPGWLARYPRA